MSKADQIEIELASEKSLFGVYRNSHTYAENAFDKYARIVIGIILILSAILLVNSKEDLFPVAAKAINEWVVVGVTYSTAILGFLIAGFTIFSTMTRIEIFIALSMQKHPSLGVSQLKFIFFSFLRVFIYHIFLIFVCISVVILKDLSRLHFHFIFDAETSMNIRKGAVAMLLPFVGYSILSSILHLKTFVWNLYQSIIIAISGAAVLYELDKVKKDRNV